MTGNLRGILAILAGSTAFVGHDATVKLVSTELPASEIIVLRGMIATAMMVVGVVAVGAVKPLSILLQPLMLLRVLASAGATVFIVLALRYLPLATATTVLQATPLVVTAGATLLYGETVGWRRWAAIFAGFLGVVLIVKPGGGFGAAAYLILLGMLCASTRDLSTRGLPKDIPSIFVATAGIVAATTSGMAIIPLDPDWIAPTPWVWGVLALCAACVFAATTFMTAGPLWGDVPDMIAWLGIALVFGAGLYTLHREHPSLRKTPSIPAT